MPDDDEVLDISAEDLDPEEPQAAAGTAADASGPVLDLSLDDLDDEAYPAAAAFPAVTGDQLLAARNSITIRTVCTSTGRAFTVRYVEDQPGVFTTEQVTPGDEGEAGSSPGAAAVGQVEGTFEVTPDYACPFCGSTAVLVCGHCGVDLCAGTGKAGGILTCPNCKSQMQVGGKATSATGLLGKGKGKGKG